MDDGTGWVRTSRVGDQLIKRYPDFDVRNFGSKSLNKFLASLPELRGRGAHSGKRQPHPVCPCEACTEAGQKSLRREESAKRTTRKKKYRERFVSSARLSKKCVHPWPSLRGAPPAGGGGELYGCPMQTDHRKAIAPDTSRVRGIFI